MMVTLSQICISTSVEVQSSSSYIRDKSLQHKYDLAENCKYFKLLGKKKLVV